MLAPPRIKPPCTDAKAALPTESIYDDVQRVFDLIEDERHMSAYSLYTSALERLNPPDLSDKKNDSPNRKVNFRRTSNHGVFHKKSKKGKEKADEVEQARQMLKERKNELDDLQVGNRYESKASLVLCVFANLLSLLCRWLSGTLQHVSKGQNKFRRRR